LYASLTDCSPLEFEAAILEHNEDGGSETYTDGYYLQKNLDYEAMGSELAYFSDIISATDTMNDYEIAEILSDNAGYHIIMKYPPSPKAYENPVNEVWFKNFTTTMIQELFMDECEKLYGEMVIHDKVLATVSDIKKIGANYDF